MSIADELIDALLMEGDWEVQGFRTTGKKRQFHYRASSPEARRKWIIKNRGLIAIHGERYPNDPPPGGKPLPHVIPREPAWYKKLKKAPKRDFHWDDWRDRT